MRWRREIKEAAIGGGAGIIVVLLFAASKISNLEDLDHLGSAVVGVLTIPLVILSFVLYRETQKTRLENSMPRLVLTIEPGRYFGFFDVVIANVGRGTAFNVQTTIDPDIVIHEDGFDAASLSANRIISPAVLKPGQEMRQYLGRLNEIQPSTASVECRYVDERGVAHIDTNAIDLRVYESAGQLGPDNYLHEINKNLESIAKTVNKITSTDRVRVDTYDAADREKKLDRRTQERRLFRARTQAAAIAPGAATRPNDNDGGIDSAPATLPPDEPAL